MNHKKTKIVATIGPATESIKMLSKLISAGVNVVRLNCSHGTHDEHIRRIENTRAVAQKHNTHVAVLQDLSGPKIRIGDFSTESITLKEGSTFILTTKKIIGDEMRVHINYPKLPQEVVVGGYILLDDGKKSFQVVDVTKDEIVCRVVVGGKTKGRRGVNIPGAHLSISSITPKDVKDLAFGIKHKVDFVALSFVRNPKDILKLRKILTQAGSDAGIIAKIETPQAVAHIDEIIEASDGIMVARGDLAIEVPAEQVPMVQKMIIEKCNRAGKPVITATQMLESMIHAPVPTRAEVSDIANAILDGTDAVMLSEETTLGLFPVEAVNVMSRVAREVECRKNVAHKESMVWDKKDIDIVNSVTEAAVHTARDVKAKLIVALTHSGFSARMVSRYKPDQVILALSQSDRACNKLALSFGCHPVPIKAYKTIADAFSVIRVFCLKHSLAQKGDRVVVVAGAPFNMQGVQTNLVVVEVI